MIYRFDSFSLDTDSLELRRDDEVVAVEPQVFSVLTYLIENRDRVIGKDELIEAVWDGRAISDGALNSRINAVRRAVGDSGEAQNVIKTFPRRGFRFVGTVSEGNGARERADAPGAVTQKPSIAVLPFVNLSDDPAQAHFADGIAEDLITALSRMRWFRVIARGSSFAYRDRSIDIRDVARDLDARYVIEGSVRKAGNTIRLTVQLAEGDTGAQIWAERYDRDLEDMFAVQDELTLAIIGAAEPAMSRSEQERARRKPPDSLDAWEAYQQGMAYLYKHTEAEIAKARDLFRRAIALDPQFALAHAGYARTYYWNVLLVTSDANRKEAEAAARRAVELDPDEAETHLAMTMVYWANGDINRGIPEAEIAISLNPSYAAAHHMLATLLVHAGRAEEALPHIYTAIELSPKDGEIGLFHARAAIAYLYLREHEKAVEWGRKAVRLPGIQWPAHCFLIASLAHLGRMDEAKEALADLLAFRPGLTLSFIRDRYPTPARGENFEHLLDGLRRPVCKRGDTGRPDQRLAGNRRSPHQKERCYSTQEGRKKPCRTSTPPLSSARTSCINR